MAMPLAPKRHKKAKAARRFMVMPSSTPQSLSEKRQHSEALGVVD
jgi:hypothetical protein